MLRRLAEVTAGQQAEADVIARNGSTPGREIVRALSYRLGWTALEVQESMDLERKGRDRLVGLPALQEPCRNAVTELFWFSS